MTITWTDGAQVSKTTTDTFRELVTKGRVARGSFVDSVLRIIERGGSLTDRQLAVVEKIVAEKAQQDADNAARKSGEHGSKGSPITHDVIRRITDFLDGSGLKQPKITYGAADTKRLTITTASASSANPGCRYVKYDGNYLGKITPDGRALWARTAERAHIDLTLTLLQQFLDNPREAAAEYGRQTCSCCFCGLPLTDERSRSVGWGPVCAENYGLPWGEVGPVAVKQEAA
jgi:hypothetical protein